MFKVDDSIVTLPFDATALKCVPVKRYADERHDTTQPFSTTLITNMARVEDANVIDPP